MKKTLFSLITILSFSVLTIHAQTTKISFETSEGYSVGSLSGQQGWTVWGGLPVANPQVTGSNATDGVNSFTMGSNGEKNNSCGIEKNISSLVTANDVDISFDYKFDGINGSDYEIAIYNDNVDYYYTAALNVSYIDGKLSYRNATAFVDGPVLTPNKWYNFKIKIKKSNSTLEYLVDGTSIYSGPLGTYKNVHTIDFVYDDYGTGFKVDNILITNISDLSTREVSQKNNIVVSPNPVTEKLNIETEGKIISVSIYDFKGSLVKTISGDSKTVNVSDLSVGSYLIKVKTNKAEFTKKVIKK